MPPAPHITHHKKTRHPFSALHLLQLRLIQFASLVAPVWTGRWAAKKFTTPPHFLRLEWETEILQQGEKIPMPGNLAGWRWGHGPVVLLIHGWGGRGSQLGAFVKPLVTAGFQVLALDGPAHGDSPGKRTNIGEFTRRLFEIADAFGPFEGIIGHSFGAAVSVYAASRGLAVNRLVLVSCPCSVQSRFDDFSRLTKLGPVASRLFQEMTEKEAGIKASEAQIELLGTKIKAETLLVHDRQDKEILFSEAEKIAGAWKNAHLLMTEGLGHRRILRSPKVVRQVVGFLKKE